MEQQPNEFFEVETLAGEENLEMPRPTVAPLMVALGLILLAASAPFGPAFVLAGAAILVTALGIWVGELLPGRGHCREPLVEMALRPIPVTAEPGTVERLLPGMPGHRARLPESVHPLSAGIKGGLIGGLVMPLPAFLDGIISGHGIWYPVNLLAGMVVPGIGNMTTAELQEFRPSLLVVGIVIHAAVSVVFGLLYGVLLPTLPPIRSGSKPQPLAASLAWGGVLLPTLRSSVSYGLMGIVNPLLEERIDWPWFIVSQFVFGAVAALVVHYSETVHVPPAGTTTT